MKKTTKIKIGESLIQALPPIGVLIANHQFFVESTGKSITLAGMFIVLVLGLIFKDYIKNFYKTPSVVKVSLVIFIFSLIGITLGQQLVWLSGSVLAGGALSLPLTLWRNNINNKNQDAALDILTSIKGMVNKNENE